VSEDAPDWIGLRAHRVLPDGRVLVAIERFYNTQVTMSYPSEWPDTWSDGW
jgi:hypothetical protein